MAQPSTSVHHTTHKWMAKLKWSTALWKCTFPVQPPEGEQKNLSRKIFSKKVLFTPFYFSILHSLIPNLSVGGIVASTAPVTIEVVSASKGIGDSWALSTDEIHTSSSCMIKKKIEKKNI